jgi:hypothetical protein
VRYRTPTSNLNANHILGIGYSKVNRLDTTTNYPDAGAAGVKVRCANPAGQVVHFFTR